MLDPPPTATNASHGPLARACSMAAVMLSSVGSTCTPSKTTPSMPNAPNWPATCAGIPVAATPGSVTTRARCTPYWLRSKPISPDAPGPNLSCGAPYVKTDSAVAGTVLVIGPLLLVSTGMGSLVTLPGRPAAMPAIRHGVAISK